MCLMRVHLSQERVPSLLSALAAFRPGKLVSLKCFQRLLGPMAVAAAAIVCQLVLLHMRPLQLWLKVCVPCTAWRKWTNARLGDSRLYEQANHFVQQDHVQARGFNGQSGQEDNCDNRQLCFTGGLGSPLTRPAYCSWRSAQSQWHIKCLELKAVSVALQHLPFREELSCSYSNGQHDCGVLHQSPRGYCRTCMSGRSV